MFRLLLFIGVNVFLFIPPDILATDIPEGCIVKERLEVKPIKFDSVDFQAHLSDSSSKRLFEARITCYNEHLNFDIVTVTEDSVHLQKTRNGINAANYESSKPPALDHGWMEFSLHLVGNYSLQDREGRSWLPENITVDCQHIEKAEIEGPHLMRHCPDKMPTWEIKGRGGRVIPILISKQNVTSEDLILYSNMPFTPHINIGDADFVIGWYNSSLVTKKTDSVDPLPRYAQHLVMMLIEEGHHTRMKILDGSRELYSKFLLKKPTHMRVSGIAEDEFILIKKTHKEPDEEAPTCDKVTDIKYWGLVVGLVIASVLLLFLTTLIFFYRRSQQQKHSDLPKLPGILSSDYLEPRGGLSPPALPRSFPPTVVTGYVREEAIYEEIDEKAIGMALEMDRKRRICMRLESCNTDSYRSPSAIRKSSDRCDFLKKNRKRNTTSQYGESEYSGQEADSEDEFRSEKDDQIYVNMSPFLLPQGALTNTKNHEEVAEKEKEPEKVVKDEKEE